MNKTAQITNFIIIGVVLLLAAALFLVLKYQVLQVEPEEVVSPEYVPVKDYVEMCMHRQAEQAVLLMGQQGGWTELPSKIRDNPQAHIEFVRGGMFRVPLWYYYGETRIPSLGLMERQIEQHIKQHLDSCLNNFTQFEEKFAIQNSTFEADAAIGDQKVVVTADFPLTITRKADGQVARLSSFSTELKVKLKPAWELGKVITEQENRGMFLENTTLDLMVLNPEIPFTNLQFKCGRLTWYQSDVIQELKDTLYYNLPRIRVANTDYDEFREEESYGKLHYLWQVTDESYPHIRVGLNYETNWPLTMKVRPSHGNVMKSNYGKGMNSYLHFLCVNMYHFTYDVSYPVEVVLREETSFDGEGYTFRFGLPVYIDHNQGARQEFSQTEFITPIEGGAFCEQTTQNQFYIRAVDSRTGLGLEGVNLSFECVNHRCELGETEFDGLYYRLQTPLIKPCPMGRLVADHPDYLKAEKVVDYQTSPQKIKLEMKPLKEFEYTVVKHYSSEPRWEYGLEKDQYAIIAIEDEDHDYNVFDNYPKHYAIFEKNLTLIKDGEDYQLDILLMENDTYIGGYKANWTVSYEELADNTHLKFHVMEYSPTPQTEQETSEMITFLENSSNYPIGMQPEFSQGFE